MPQADAQVRCCHERVVPVKVLEPYGGLSLVQRAKDGELFMVPTDQIEKLETTNPEGS